MLLDGRWRPHRSGMTSLAPAHVLHAYQLASLDLIPDAATTRISNSGFAEANDGEINAFSHSLGRKRTSGFENVWLTLTMDRVLFVIS